VGLIGASRRWQPENGDAVTRRTTNAAFTAFDQEINLDPREREAAQRRHGEITACLVAAKIATTTFLQGSFARKTMRKPLKDVDMVIVLNESYRELWTRPGGPAAAMYAIQTALAASFPGVAFDVEDQPAHALQVTFADCGFTFDLVPAFADVDGSEDVYIANRETDQWEWSNTRTLNRLVSGFNTATTGQLVHQIRMGKTFKGNQPVLRKLCGLVIESFACAAITKRMTHAEALVVMFEHAATAVQGKVLDPTCVDDLSAKWSVAERSAYTQAFAEAARRGREALALEADGEHEAAIEVWHAIIGAPYPQPTTQTAQQALTALGSGSITSAGRAVVSQRGTQSNRPARSWRIR
jgi:hypothetical protein